MNFFKGLFSLVKNNPVKVLVIVIVAVVFLGSTITGFYNSIRAKVPQVPLPAPK